MIKFDIYYYIAESEVEAIFMDDQEGDYPYTLTVRTKAGHDYTVNYAKKQERDNEALNISSAVEQYIENQQKKS